MMTEKLKTLLCAGVVVALLPGVRPPGSIVLGLQQERMDAIVRRILPQLTALGVDPKQHRIRFALAEAILDEMKWHE
jgi:hypothetical protein